MTADIAVVAPGPLDAIGRALEARLRLVFREQEFGLVWLPARPTAQTWNRLVKTYPMLGLSFLGWSKGETQSDLTGLSHWAAIIAVRNPDVNTGRLFGDKTGPGILTLLPLMAALLNGLFVPGIGSANAHDMSHVVVDGLDREDVAFGMVEVTVKTGFGLGDLLTGDGTVGDALGSMSIAWSFDGGQTTAVTEEVMLP